jgi:hypothetical protein
MVGQDSIPPEIIPSSSRDVSCEDPPMIMQYNLHKIRNELG